MLFLLASSCIALKSRRKDVKLKINLWRLELETAENHCLSEFSEFLWECLHRDRHCDCSSQSLRQDTGVIIGQFIKVQCHGNQLPNQTYRALTLFWGDQTHVCPKKGMEDICKHMNYLIFQAEVINRQLIHRDLSMLEAVWVHRLLLLKSSNSIYFPHGQQFFKAWSKEGTSIS